MPLLYLALTYDFLFNHSLMVAVLVKNGTYALKCYKSDLAKPH